MKLRVRWLVCSGAPGKSLLWIWTTRYGAGSLATTGGKISPLVDTMRLAKRLWTFQKELKALSRRGVLLAIVSKNDEAIALEAIDKHPEMVLRREDFVAWRINWNDKAANLEGTGAWREPGTRFGSFY